jgi:hypothetical protein
MRNDQWLDNQLGHIWNKHFSDVPMNNEVIIKFGRNARTRLGSIRQARVKQSFVKKLSNRPSIITITGYFRNEIVPEYVVNLVIAHELCHYAHGFCSPHPQLYEKPHQGKVIDKELYKRGFGENIKAEKIWLKEKWPSIIGARTHKGKTIIRKNQHKGLGILKFLISN